LQSSEAPRLVTPSKILVPILKELSAFCVEPLVPAVDLFNARKAVLLPKLFREDASGLDDDRGLSLPGRVVS